mgnify:CR=1 FL=1
MTKPGRKQFGKRPPPLEPDLMALMQLVERKQYLELESAARRLLGKRPGHPLVEKALSVALIGLFRYEDALPLLRHAVKRNPHDPELQNNLGITLNQLMYWEESLQAFEKAMQGLPHDPEIAKHMGVALFRMQRPNEAVPFLIKAIELYDGDYVEAVETLADCLMNANRVDEAWTCYKELHDSDPDNVAHLANLLGAAIRRCAWEGLDDLIARLRNISDDLKMCIAQPFMMASVPGVSRSEMLGMAQRFARHSVPSSVIDAQSELSLGSHLGRRVRIAYLSGDLLRHPVGFIIPELMELHDRSRFETFAYSTRRAPDDDPIRPRLQSAFEHFVEVGELPVRQLQEKIRQDDIDILVDLTGWTAHGRPEALALRCAPIQVNWLGYPGTMGHAALADYIIGDPVVTPLAHADSYSELIAQLPHCYLPADTRRQVDLPPSRVEAGLPEDRFVFCSLNNNYKYNPEVWDIWCSILREAPDAVLWLTYHGETVVGHLLQEAEKRGVTKERLCFAKHVPSNEAHLARLGLADLALDPFPYNSHSTGVDTLWAGVPMVTMLGEQFASRVGASVVTAAGLAELVATDVVAYRELALGLYRDRERLARLKAKLVRQPGSVPLFDMPAYARSLEALYCRMLDDAASGQRRHLPAA